jgi:uncharacterized membrane protein
MDLFLAIIFTIGGVVCHQRPERSFFIEGHQLPVCARCTGLYLTGAIGLVGWFTMKLARRWRPIAIDPRLAVRLLLIAAIPTAVSLISGAIGWWDGSNLTRALLAIPLGVTAGAIVAAVSTKDLR